MADLTLTQSFSMIALNAQNSIYMTTAKKVALRCMAVAVIMEICLDNGITCDGDKFNIPEGVPGKFIKKDYWESVMNPLLGKSHGEEKDMNWWLKKASALSTKKLVIFEHKLVNSLCEMNLIKVIPGLLGSDLDYDTAGVPVKEYCSDIKEYSNITEGIRAEILEDGPVTDESICMLWLLRESGCMHDFFSRKEIEKAAARMNELYKNSLLAKAIFPIHIYRGIEMCVKEYLRLKTAVVTTAFGSGINFAFPILQRSNSVFIDCETWLPDSEKRLEDLKKRLVSNGHEFEVVHSGPSPLVKIDNFIYEAVPQSVNPGGTLSIHGVRLMPIHRY